MSTFKTKVKTLKEHLNSKDECICPEPQIHIVNDCCKPQPQAELCLQQPIIIERKAATAKSTMVEKEKKTKVVEKSLVQRKKVEPWQPVTVPVRDKKIDIENISINAVSTQPVQK